MKCVGLKLIKGFFLWGAFAIVFMHHGASSVAAPKAIKIEKVFHHKAAQSHDTAIASSVDLGVISFYFSDQTLVNDITSSAPDAKVKSKNMRELIFMFPQVALTSAEVKKFMNIINDRPQLYQGRLEMVTKPFNGVKFVVSYDPNKVSATKEEFAEVGGGQTQPGVRFKFYNQELLNAISARSNKKALNIALAQKVHDIVIDCGHGGYDTGAVSPYNVREKDVALAVGTHVADLLKKKGFNVIMTREDDSFIPLDERTTFANSLINADLFLSIHANSSVNKNKMGIETYYLDPVVFSKSVSFLDEASQKVTLGYERMRSEYSKLFAQMTHQNLIQQLHKSNPEIVDRKVHHTVLQVFLGAVMPAVLIEVGYLSNQLEGKLLGDPCYQKNIAQGICNGIVSCANIVKTV